MMILNMVKKDLLISKSMSFITMAVIIVIPIAIMVLGVPIPAIIPFLYMVVIGVIILLQGISQEESKYPKAIALLMAAPYSRNSYVVAKYLLFILIFGYCYLVNSLTALLIRPDHMLELLDVLIIFFIGALIYSIYMPVELKYGFSKAKYIFQVVILSVSMGPALLVNILPHFTLDFSFLSHLSVNLLIGVAAVASIIALGTSLVLSMRIFTKREL